MKTISLTQGQAATVDDSDFEWLSRWKWCVHWKPRQKAFYAERGIRVNGKIKMISMHRFILDLNPGDPRLGDHINSNTLDNRRENLRIASPAQNAHNRKVPKTNTTGFKNVSIDPSSGRFRGKFTFEGKRIDCGCFATPVEAFEAVSVKVRELHGEFARME